MSKAPERRLSLACLACLRGEEGAPEEADEARSEVEALLLLQAAGTDTAEAGA